LSKVIKAIPVRDAHGDVLTLYEYRRIMSFLAVMKSLGRGARRLALDTGEEVRRVDKDVYELVATGERLTRIK
jgi:hypothetical protein